MSGETHIHIHFPSAPEFEGLNKRLASIESGILSVKQQQERLIMSVEEGNQTLDEINVLTNKLAEQGAVILANEDAQLKLIEELRNGSNDAKVDALVARMKSTRGAISNIVDTLAPIAVPGTPIPPPPVDPPSGEGDV